MAHGAHRDRRARSRIESFILDRDGSLTPLPERAAPLAQRVDSVQGLVAASVDRTRELQSDLHAAAERPAFPERLRRWMRQQIINLEARNAQMQQLLTGTSPARQRRRGRPPVVVHQPPRPRDLLMLSVVMTSLCGFGAAAIAGVAFATGLFGTNLAMTLLGPGLAGAAMGFVGSLLSIGVSVGRAARRELQGSLRSDGVTVSSTAVSA